MRGPSIPQDKQIATFTRYVIRAIQKQFHYKMARHCFEYLQVEEIMTQAESVGLSFVTYIFQESKIEKHVVKIQIPYNSWYYFIENTFLVKIFSMKYKTITKEVTFSRQFLFPKAYSPDHPELKEFVIQDDQPQERDIDC